jgi:hypothetical protein
MKFNLAVLAALALLSTINSQLSRCLAQGTAFTYQGQLQNNGALANGNFDLKFTLFKTNITGTAVAGPVTNSDVGISNGLFTVTIDFGGAVWNGETNWLEIAVETNGGSPFTKLSPRQQVTPTPYAITAENLGSGGLSGTYGGMVTLSNAANQFTGAFTGDGSALTNVNAAALGGLTASSFWQLGGNTAASGSQIVGTLNNQPFDLYAGGVRAMRLVLRTDASGTYSNAPNVIGGSPVNLVKGGVVGGTVGGGGGMDTNGTSYPNQVNVDFGTISGGLNNNISSSGLASFIGGGFQNTASGTVATVGGGQINTASGTSATVGGGNQNSATNFEATVGGGLLNIAGGSDSTVPGGSFNIAAGQDSFAAGNNASANNDYCFVWADSGTSSDRDSEFKIQASSGVYIVVSGSSGLNPAALEVNSTSSSGVALHAHQGSSDSTAVFGNSGTGDLIKGFSGPSAGTLAFEVQNDGTVLSKGVVLTSDRNAKENFADLDSGEVLAKVVALPVAEWNYRNDPAGTKHIGPVAQDFHTAFGLNGADDKHISVVDEGGVALAAIQGLNEKVEGRSQKEEAGIQKSEARIQKLEAENEELKARLEKLEHLMASGSEK